MVAFQNIKPLTVYIGYDPREDDAYEVCKGSLEGHVKAPILLRKLDICSRSAKQFYKRTFTKQSGQMIDDVDGRPFSTMFAFSRFLVPFLQNYKGWAIFCDCDFLFTADINALIPALDDRYAIMSVKHNYLPHESVKMDGQAQIAYPRKNWSSFMAFNCGHEANKALTPEVVNTQPGRWLHGFGWLSDEEIGELSQTWNWLAGVSAPLSETPSAIHFTLGTPNLPGYENSPYADLWNAEFNHIQDFKRRTA